MSTEIFNNAYTDTEAWSVSGAVVTFRDESNSAISYNLIMQNIRFVYQRSVRDVFPINTTSSGQMKQLSLIGSPAGQMTCTGILGPKTAIKALLAATGKSCFSGSGCSVDIAPFTKACSSDAGSSAGQTAMVYHLNGLILNSLQVDIQGGELAIITQPLAWTFRTLTFDGE